MKIIYLLMAGVLMFLSLEAQINIGGKPYSFDKELNIKNTRKSQNVAVSFPMLDMKKVQKEDKYNDSLGKPFRYGLPIDVELNTQNSGEWIDLEGGDKIWKLIIKCPLAKSINLSYDKFWIPDGGVLYLYDKNRTSYIGGFNKKNNGGTKNNPSGFATELIFSDEIVLEYYEPKEVQGEALISISKVIYGYRDLQFSGTGFGEAPCTINVNCSPEGNNWKDEKTSVALLAMDGVNCTGCLVNNTFEDGTPYFLTANHCIQNANFQLDAIEDPDASFFIFYWNYESSGCSNGSEPISSTTRGATVVANNSNPNKDFALLKLTESPYELTPQVQAYFSGWDRTTPSGGGVCIHHPKGDIKKISTSNSIVNDGDFWKVPWIETSNGNSIIYPGSSGSPLYNSYGRIIGQLYGPDTPYTCYNQAANFPKISLSWNNSSGPERRLKDWLDPNNTGANYLDGGYFCGKTLEEDKLLISNNTVWNSFKSLSKDLHIEGYLTITNTLVMYSKREIVVENGGTLKVSDGAIKNASITVHDGGSLILENGGLLLLNGDDNLNVRLGATFDQDYGNIALGYPTEQYSVELSEVHNFCDPGKAKIIVDFHEDCQIFPPDPGLVEIYGLEGDYEYLVATSNTAHSYYYNGWYQGGSIYIYESTTEWEGYKIHVIGQPCYRESIYMTITEIP